jgi:SH3 domain protein
MTSMRAAGSQNPSQRGVSIWRRVRPLALALLCIAPAALQAEPGWVKGEVHLNLRTGPSNEYRIIGGVQTGDRLEVLELGSGWTRVRAGDKEGWIPEGYLQDVPTPGVLLEETQAKATELRAQVESLGAETAKLKQENSSISERDTQQRSEIETLTRENLELKAGARWPEWITGAGILTAGMVMGWILHVTAGRRQRPRIRL